MGSSVAALAGRLETVAQRPEKKLRGSDGTLGIFADDLEDEVAGADLEEGLAVALGQLVEDRASRRVGERLEHVAHGAAR